MELATYVIVHGGWAGGWAFSQLCSLLRAQGHEVYTPTLTGVGERVHLAGPDVGMETWIEDVLNVLIHEDIEDAVLVGYSSGGFVITGAASRMPERIRHLAYIDAMMPSDGEVPAEIFAPELARALSDQMRDSGDGWFLPPPPIPPSDQPTPTDYSGLSREEIESIFARLTIHPGRGLFAPMSLRSASLAEIPGTYILCTDKSPEWPVWSAVRTSASRARQLGYEYREMHTGHCPQWTATADLADLLLKMI